MLSQLPGSHGTREYRLEVKTRVIQPEKTGERRCHLSPSLESNKHSPQQGRVKAGSNSRLSFLRWDRLSRHEIPQAKYKGTQPYRQLS